MGGAGESLLKGSTLLLCLALLAEVFFEVSGCFELVVKLGEVGGSEGVSRDVLFLRDEPGNGFEVLFSEHVGFPRVPTCLHDFSDEVWETATDSWFTWHWW